jgi:signal transduction histidine kinase
MNAMNSDGMMGREHDAAVLAAVLDAVPARIALLGRSGRILLVNRLWREAALGDGFIGSNLGPGADYVEACRAAGMDALAEGLGEILAGQREDLAHAYRNGSEAHAFRCIAARLGEAAPGAAVVLHFEETGKDAAATLASVGAVASGIAHDLNNLLVGMAGVLDAALAELAPRSEAAARLRAVRVGVDHAGGLVQQLLAFAKGDTSRRRRVDLADEVDRALDLLAATLPPNIALERALEVEAEAVADPVQLQQLVLNLGTNSVDAIGAADGRIVVRLDRVPPRRLPEGLKRVAHARLRFEDDGPGIPAEIAGRVFEPFFSTKPRERGTGLGLAVVQRIVAGQGGRIELSSAPGEGTAVTIFLPLSGSGGPP